MKTPCNTDLYSPTLVLVIGFLFSVPALAQQDTSTPAADAAPRPAGTPPAAPAEESHDHLAPDEARMMANHPIDESKSIVKPGTGFYWQSTDGDFSFAPRLRAQFLYELEDEEGADLAQSIQIRRARLQFKGNYFGKANKFKVELAFSSGDVGQNDGAPPATSLLLDWYLDFAQLRDLTLRVGQYKIAYNRQRVVSSGDLEFVDRSIANAEFNLDRDLGFDVRSEDLFGLNMLRYYVGLYAGEGRNTRGSYDLGMLYLGRVEFLPMGMFDDYAEGDLERTPSPKLSLGVGAAKLMNSRFNRGILGSIPDDGGTTDFTNVTADAVFRWAGVSATTEWMYRNGDRDFGTTDAPEPARDGYGAMFQVSYLFPTTRFQVAGRYAFIEPSDSASSLPASTELGGALSYYFAHHPFKVQGDVFRLTEDEGAVRITNNRVRVQLQASY